VVRAAIASLVVLPALACGRPGPTELHPHHAAVRISPADRAGLARGCEPVPRGDAERRQRLEHLFRTSGCPSVETARVKGTLYIVCTLPGESESTIAVAASVNGPSGGADVVDNWSGACMLPALYWALRREPRHHRFDFVGFTSPTGLMLPPRRPLGTIDERRYVRRPTPWNPLRMRAMVYVRELGRGDPAAWVPHADPDLWLDLASVAVSLDLPLRGAVPRPDPHSGTESLGMLEVPSITLHSVRAAGEPAAAGGGDGFESERYFASYRLLATYLAYLDQSLRARDEGDLP
jgi:hypothetical protein